MDKVVDVGVPLKTWDLAMNRGVVTGYNKAFVVDGHVRQRLVAGHASAVKLLKPMLQGRDVRRWHARFNERWLIYARRGVQIEAYPSVFRWMQQHEHRLTRKSGANAWYELQASPSDEAHRRFAGEKLFWMDMTDRGRFAYSASEMYCNDKAFVMSGELLKYLCGVLNSSLVTWLVGRTALTTGMGLPQWKKYTVEAVPVPRPTDEEEGQIVELVERLIEAASNEAGSGSEQVARIENELDRVVYQLYGLAGDEVTTIERRLAQ